MRSDGRPFNEYLKMRRRVLFEVWFPDSQDIVLDSMLCRRCGFMSFSPRPTKDDIEAKYRFLQVNERDIGGQGGGRGALERDRKRAMKVFGVVSRHAKGRGRDVLDVGGGNGKLLKPFIDAGHTCSLVDYNVNPITGVTKIADRLEDVPMENRYDIVICSHVMEHLADPAGSLRNMAGLLRDGGVIYGEVPLGVWGGIGIENDPVTHVNFFTRASYESLFRKNGFEILDANQEVGVYNKRIDVIYVVGKKSNAPPEEISWRPDETRRLLAPTFLMKLGRVLRLRRRRSAGPRE